MRIRTQITLTLYAVVAAAFAIAWTTASLVAGRLLSTVQAEEHRRAAVAVGAVARAALSPQAEPVSVLREHLRYAPFIAPNVDYAFVEDANGRVLVHSDPRLEGVAGDAWKKTRKSETEYSAPAGDGGAEARTARIGAKSGGAAAVLSGTRATLLPAMVLLAAVAILFATFLGLGLSSLFAGPIEALAGAAESVEHGNLEVQVPTDASGELGELSSRFNDMVDQLRVADEMKARFIATVSHDLRSPLAAIKMSADYLLQDASGSMSPENARILAAVLENATRLGTFVSNILDAAKMRAGRMEYHVQPVELEKIVKRLEELYRVALKNQDISLSLALAPGLARLQADPEKIERILTNLLSNAMKFTPPGGTIEIGARAAGDIVETWVADSGPGIPPEAVPRLFHAFEQAADDGTSPHGTGLGLFIVKEMAEAMGGSATIDKDYERGARIVVTLPSVSKFPLPLAGEGGGEGASIESPAPASPNVSGRKNYLKVLVIDDDFAMTTITQHFLLSNGYAAEGLREGRLAVETARKTKPDVILLDLHLRDASGENVLRGLKADPDTARIPIILCSAVLDLPDIQRLLEDGAACFLPKPLNPSELDLRIRQVVYTESQN